MCSTIPAAMKMRNLQYGVVQVTIGAVLLELCVAPAKCAINKTDWMYTMYQDMPDTRIMDILIPGTHNSGMYTEWRMSSFIYDVARNIGAALSRENRVRPVYWSRYQSEDIFNQLMGGIRYLDIRVQRSDAVRRWQAGHGRYAAELGTTLRDITEFAKKHQREVVLVDMRFSGAMTTADHRELIVHLLKASPLSRELLAPSSFDDSVTFTDMWTHNKSVILLYDYPCDFPDDGVSAWLWNRADFISSTEAPGPGAAAVYEALLDGVVYRPLDGFHVSSIVLSDGELKDSSRCLWWLCSCGPDMLLCLTADRLHKHAGQWLQRASEAGRARAQLVNIVAVDYYRNGPVVETCLALNAKSAQPTRNENFNNDTQILTQ